MSIPEKKETSSRILVVNLKMGHLTPLRGMLGREDYSIVEATNLDDLWGDIKNKHYFDLIITTIDIPGYSTDSYIELLKRHYPNKPVIIATEKKKMEAFKECAQVGGDDYVTLPLDSKNVITVVNRVIELGRQNTLFDSSSMSSQCCDLFAGYELKETLGKGAMGAVYLAQKVERGVTSQYALKVLHPVTSQDENQIREVLERFLREAETASQLRHPNILKIIDYGLAEDELQPYIVMELVKGQSLRNYVNGEMNANFLQKIKMMCQVAEALYVIHSHNLFHRDVKPENIMVDGDLNVKVTDFGFVRLPNSELTQTLKVVGTPFYMAPEAYTSSKVDERADIFSFGVVAYELLLDRKPFMANSFPQLRKAIQTEMPLGPKKIDPSFPIEVQNMLALTLKKDPKDRYPSAAEIAVDLNNYLKEISKPPETTILDLSDGHLIKSAMDMKAEVDKEYRNSTDWS